ncbi:MAG: zinc ribbon domain-containing protein [Acidobacteriota bacterium]
MATINCTSCGAEIDSTARFCRRCGQPVFAAEAPTARMEIPSQQGAETQGFGPAMTAPTFGPPLPVAEPFDKAKQKRTTTILIGMVAFLILAMIGLGLGLFFLSKNRSAIGDQPPAQATEMRDQSDLIYPGSTVNLRVSSDEGKKVLQLRTDDSVDDVVAWYDKKMKNAEKVYLPVGVTITDRNTAVVITGIGEGTQILVTQK